MPVEAKGTPQPLNLGEDVAKKDFRQMCKYGKDCYQKNPMHHQKFRHPKDGESEPQKDNDIHEATDVAKEPSPKKQKLDTSEPEQVVEEIASEKVSEEIDGLACSKPEEKASNDEEEPQIADDGSDLVPEFKDWPKEPIKSVEEKFLTKMPEDFMAFWEFCRGINRENPREALVKSCGLLLVGPYDIVSGEEFKSTKLNDYLCHHRYYRDPPEFQTVLASVEEESNFHIGYFRDDPKEVPVFMAAYGGKKGTPEYDNFKLTMMGDNLFAVLFLYIGQLVNKVDPFKMTSLQKLKESVHLHASMKNQDQSFSLEAKTTSMKCRDKKKVAATFHGAGMVVPYNKDTQVGYREIPETNAALKKILAKIVEATDEEARNKAFDDLQELVTNVQFANDEGDPGMGLELGIDVLMYGGNCLNSTARHLLSVAYDLLNREAFGKIANAHLNRRKESQACFKAV